LLCKSIYRRKDGKATEQNTEIPQNYTVDIIDNHSAVFQGDEAKHKDGDRSG
jgi:hypothetical protein